MSREQDIENATKAAQCAQLLLQDLQYLNRYGDAMLSMLVLPEIEKVADVKQRLEAIISALQTK
jgi:hypothetical protein